MKLKTKRTKQCVEVRRGDEVAKFWGHPLTPKETTYFLNHCIDKEWEKNQRFESVNLYKYKMDKIDRVIDEWEGIGDENGTPLECTRENKEIIYLFNPDVIDEALEKFDKLSKTENTEQEYLEKNLLAGLNGPASQTE